MVNAIFKINLQVFFSPLSRNSYRDKDTAMLIILTSRRRLYFDFLKLVVMSYSGSIRFICKENIKNRLCMRYVTEQ